MKAYIGYDSREDLAYQVAHDSLMYSSNIVAEPINADRLRSVGLYSRNIDARGDQQYDLPSQAPCSTQFASSRFLVPIICQSGWALFTDCDVVFLRDVNEILEEVEDFGKAVYVVKHEYDPKESVKMDGQKQTSYPRKNWSSVMLFNCDHPANTRLTIESVNRMPGRDLHGFYWLNDDEIGSLSPNWNWLVNVSERPSNPGIAHFTLGGPWIDGWKPQPYDEIWSAA